MLTLKNLAVDHGKLRALWDVSLHVGKGERVGLLGANGAGKSTAMGAIVGLYPVAAGEISFDGAPMKAPSTTQTVAGGISLVPEGRRLFPGMSVWENLVMGAYAAPKRELDAPLEQVFGLFPILRQKAAQNAGELSGGQQQMVAIGRALMSRPRLLLLDEPFIGVAPLLVDEILAALRQIANAGVTLVLVEQNTHRALDFVERAYVLENGRTVLEGGRDALLADPAFAAKFLGLE
ncbi:ABC transporter ATP-binding protein [Rhizobacter sp. AJA081-3]|jgi:branched-chain amino acid transport system ATP-binding protein|uniref:ABC transporter ATP-binding protein n=1 Tax=Rhizobacter sp. AJA081-3 TaxID=2753607 RepID=UPI001AE05AA6|nr:ABC transporter ATP-binding protein [Rhizobacter sp. AJA081-3]MBP6465227.1 ABC transporter ATP-binding protein [Rubrivivax sp.]QTN22163.1 ABC transporter ATP-binding protein [Rhizobacter sp. AJA081-3]